MLSRCQSMEEMSSSIDQIPVTLFWSDPAESGSSNSPEAASSTSDNLHSLPATGVHSLSSPTVESIAGLEPNTNGLARDRSYLSEKYHHCLAEPVQCLGGPMRGRRLEVISHARLTST